MKEKLTKFYQNHSTMVWVGGLIVVAVLYFVFTGQSKSTINVYTATRTDLKQTILATGQVTSQTDLNLSFPVSGVIETLPVSVGDKVTQGQVLAIAVSTQRFLTQRQITKK